MQKEYKNITTYIPEYSFNDIICSFKLSLN